MTERRILQILLSGLTAALFFSCATVDTPAQREGSSYTIPQLPLSLSLPEGFYVITWDQTSHSPEEFERIGINLDNARLVMAAAGYYLSVISPDLSYEYVLTMSESPEYRQIGSLSRFAAEELYPIADTMVANYTDKGILAQADDFFYTGGEPSPSRASASRGENRNAPRRDPVVWVVLDLVQTLPASDAEDSSQVKTVHARQYYTVVNGRAVNFILDSYEGPITPRLKEEFRLILETAVFVRQG
ncbi:MAG: hypothetical protein LBQ61_02835 [Spirochaetales bacterium]|jgi:hypothetical protein|nr:hypothetical protein [Spirochaetales bacterium]